MSRAQEPETRKRKSVEQRVFESKRLKLSHPPPQYQEADFWDNLSKIWLTKHALREFDRRTKPRNNQPLRQVARPQTRSYLRKLLQHREFIEPANDFLERCPLYILREIKQSARHGGVDLTDLRGFPEPTHTIALEMSSSRSSASRNRRRGLVSSSKTKPTTNTTVTERSKKSLPGDANYRQKLIDGGVFPYGYKYPDGRRIALPPDWEDLNRRLAKPRPSLSPSRFPEDKYHEFIDADALASDEAEVKNNVLPSMMRAMRASGAAKPEKLFNTDPIVDGVGRPTPDYYYGAPHELIHPVVRKDLRGHILPSDNSPAVPNLSMEAKGPRGYPGEALLQACHYGAHGARAMQSLQRYGEQDPVYDNHVRTLSSTYQAGQLKMYGHSVAQPGGPGTRPEYYMHQIKTWGMTGDQETFLRGATAYKNALDLTAEHRDAAIAHANGIARGRMEDRIESSSALPSFAVDSANSTLSTTQEESEDEEDETSEDESETSVEEHCRRPPAKRSSTKSHRSRSHQTRKSHKKASHRGDDGPEFKGKQRRSWFGW